MGIKENLYRHMYNIVYAHGLLTIIYNVFFYVLLAVYLTLGGHSGTKNLTFIGEV